MDRCELVMWMKGKLADAEKALRCRKEMQRTWAEGDSESWRRAGCRMTKEQRLKESATHGRIAIKCRREVEMFKAVLATIDI